MIDSNAHDKTKAPNPVVKPALQVEHLVKKYGDFVAVGGISMQVDPGEVVVFVGPNGSGKTSTIECICGLRAPTAGTVLLGGRTRSGSYKDRAWIGLQMQEAGLPPALRVGEAIELVAALYTDPMPTSMLLERLGLSSLVSSKIDTLSGGQKRRLDIALAIVGRSPLLLLDEPTSGIDPEGRSAIWDLLKEIVRETQAGMLISTHDLNEAEDYADRIIVIRNGEIVGDGTVEALVKRAGGTWRLKASGLSDQQSDLISHHRGTTQSSQGSITVLGDRDEVEQLLASIRLIDRDQPSEHKIGPTRLEDLFTLRATETTE